MNKLIARIPIFYKSKVYSVGDALPIDDQEIIEIWLKNKVAVWKITNKKTPINKKAVAVSGMEESAQPLKKRKGKGIE